jgi:hypothetical protein
MSIWKSVIHMLFRVVTKLPIIVKILAAISKKFLLYIIKNEFQYLNMNFILFSTAIDKHFDNLFVLIGQYFNPYIDLKGVTKFNASIKHLALYFEKHYHSF